MAELQTTISYYIVEKITLWILKSADIISFVTFTRAGLTHVVKTMLWS